jgi:hypothetical protein
MIENPPWQKESIICDCGCKKPFTPIYRNGILVSRKHPNCQLKTLYKEVKPKGVQFASDLGKVKETKEKRPKTPRQKWMDKADKVFSQYIRVKFSFESGGELFCKDIITGKIYGIKLVDNGHCFSRKFKSLRFWPDNCRPQNRSSNRFSGEADHYKFIDNLKKEIGEERFSLLESMRNNEVHDSEEWYRSQYETYTLLLKEELKLKSVKNPWTK